MKKTSTHLLLIALFAFLTGCEEDPCSLTTLSQARFDFRDSQTNKAVSLTQGVTVTGIATIADTLNVDTLFNQAKDHITVPLSYTNKTTYVMHYEVENLRYTTNALDSVTIVNSQIDNEEKTNFNIYYRVADAE